MASPWRNNTLEVEKEKIMSEEMEDTCEVTVEEALQMESIFSQALMDVMVVKG